MKRKFLSVLALVLVLCMLPISAFAAATDQGELSFAVSRASSCVTKSEYVPQQDIVLSNPIPQYECVTGDLVANVYLMFDGTVHIGLVLVSSKGENRSSTAYLCNYPVLEMAKNAGSRVVFYQENGCFTVYIDGDRFILENPNGVADFVELEIKNGCIISTTVPVSLQQNRSIYYSLNVDFVDNWNINGGICWAAALASKINYQTGSDLDAMDVYNRCVTYWSMENMSEADRPAGNSQWYQIAAELYNVSMTYLDRPINSEGRFVTCFRTGRPIIMRLRTEDEQSRHAVVNCGIEEDADFYELKIMDPNKAYYVYATIPHDFFETQAGFSYNAGYADYTKWIGTFY